MAPRARNTASRRRKKQKVQQQASAQAPPQVPPAGGPPYQASHGQGLANVSKQDPSEIGFSDLPPELRNNIYDYALVAPEGEAIPIANFPGISNLRDLGYNLVNTCKAIQEEARPFFYGQNIFRIDLLRIERGGLSNKMRAELDEEVRSGPVPFRGPYGILDLQQRYKDYALRHLSGAVASMSAANLASITTFVFAIHTPDPRRRENVTNVDITRAHGVLQLEIDENDRSISVIDRRVDRNGNSFRDWESTMFGLVLEDLTGIQGLKILDKEDILRIAGSVLEDFN